MDNLAQLITPEYAALLKRQHAETRWGSDTTFRHMSEVLQFAEQTLSRSILDFGSGRESLKNHIAKANYPYHVSCYDPGTGRDELVPADLVVCCDVLEHVEPTCLDFTLSMLFDLAANGIYLVIALRQAKAKMVDGSPQHLIVEDSIFWLRQLFRRMDPDRWRLHRNEVVEKVEMRVWLTRL